MSNANQETIKDIVAEMRRFGLQAAIVDFEQISPESVLYYAGRIEVAAKREREAAQSSRNTKDAMDYAATAARPFVGVDLAKGEPTYTCVEIAPGNAAAMREALEFVVHMNDSPYTTYDVLVAIQKARAALSAPARNCDVGTADEQAERFEAECKRHNNCSSCQVNAAWGEFKEGKSKSCQMIWGQMLFAKAEGGAE